MKINDFASIQVGLASPERILEWSYGEVKKPETINYRSQKPEKDGLFCERIFGPTKDWECACGKYKKVRYKGVICDRCGVEITKANVRRERMGHIALAAPVAHIWYLKGIPSRMSLLLNMTPKSLEEINYFVSWVVTDKGDTPLAEKQVLSEKEYREFTAMYGSGSFEAKTGAEALLTLLRNVNLDKEHKAVLEDLKNAGGDKRKKLIKRLETVEAFLYSDNQPEWMILTVLPVIPPDLRPMLQLDGGRFATSDLNDLYRRVITRNNRLKKLLELGTPAIIVQNEKRMLQEAVDALIDNGRRSKAITGAGGRALKSLSHSLKGKHGRFRQNLLGKRVDFSGRSVIAVGPDLKMYECGIPREMAIQLFKPFVANEIVNRKLAGNSKAAEKLIDRQDSRVWDIVEDVIKGHPVLLNRAPTLHRLGIQSFMPKLVEGRAIRLHPLVTPAFNADFDGDQMAVHLPLSEEARAEAEILMLGSHNILGPKDGKPIVTPSQDMVLGNFYLNMEESAEEFYSKAALLEALGDTQEAELWRRYGDNEGRIFKSRNEALLAYEEKQIHLHTRIGVRASSLKKTCFTDEQNNKLLICTVGKLIFDEMFPPEFPFLINADTENFIATPDRYFVDSNINLKDHLKNTPVNPDFKKSNLGIVIAEIFKRCPMDQTATILDKIKDMGFRYSTVAGMTMSLSDIIGAPNKAEKVEKGKVEAATLMRLYKRGKLTAREWERHLTQLWGDIKDDIREELMENLPRKNPINMMATSGARGNASHFTQLAGMRGLMGKPTQSKSKKDQSSIIEVPIYSSFRDGLNVSEFFISTHGVRKGLTDTALKTAESGYLTRRLVDVAQDVIVTEEDCHTSRSYLVEALTDRKDETEIESFEARIVGRFAKEQVVDPNTGEVLVDADEYISDEIADRIVKAGIDHIHIRNTFTCESTYGVCTKCYGRNMATGKIVEVGEAVGIMAAQSIGEPGTQLTMRNFHTGGVAGGSDITQGLPRVEELFEARRPKLAAILSKINGTIVEIRDNEANNGQIIVVANDKETIEHKTEHNQTLRQWMSVGTEVKAGDKLTEGQVDPKELLEVAGMLDVQNYILKEVQKVYGAQGIGISDKHIEIMIRQMLRKVIIIEANDTSLSAGVQISLPNINNINTQVLTQGLQPAKFGPCLLGISKASVETDSFLSAASFQETTKVLTDAAIKGKVDHLLGLKENVIIGKKIPAGTGSGAERDSTKAIEEMAAQLKAIRLEKAEKLKVENTLPEEMLRMRRDEDDDEDDYLDDEEIKETAADEDVSADVPLEAEAEVSAVSDNSLD
ncbi:MAG: DNA-directed RNA polymerase subunit beta' [Erysipelotrichaceae bacterium]|jgi:DNA-directed RNA polymerase subunit beta'|nr:DNA-directed RNA polymerase subunit beta' [Erysipelotrichaceae bacterium]